MSEVISTVPKHPKSTFALGGSIALQRLAYNGWSAILVFNLLLQTDVPPKDVVWYYHWMAMGLIACYLMGGVLGDLLFGNRTVAFLGAGIMCLASALFFFDLELDSNYLVGLFIAGCGMFEPNIKSMFAKTYLHDKRLLDAGFTIFYIFTNIGSFVGIIFIGWIDYSYGIGAGFLTVGLITLLSGGLLFSAKQKPKIDEVQKEPIINKKVFKQSIVLLILLAVYGIGVKLSYFDVRLEYWKIDFSSERLSESWIDILTFVFFLTISIYLVFLWSRKHFTPTTKLAIAAVVTFISFGISFLFYQENANATIVISIVALFLYTLAEIHVAPLIDSFIARLVNPRFLAIGYASKRLIALGFIYLVTFIVSGAEMLTDSLFYVGLGIFLVLSIVLVVARKKFK